MHPLLSQIRHANRWFLLMVAALLLAISPLSAVGDKPGGQPSQSKSFGKPLSEWFALYEQWVLSSWIGVELPDHVGNVSVPADSQWCLHRRGRHC